MFYDLRVYGRSWWNEGARRRTRTRQYVAYMVWGALLLPLSAVKRGVPKGQKSCASGTINKKIDGCCDSGHGDDCAGYGVVMFTF